MAGLILLLGWLCGLLALLAWWKAEKHRVAVRTALQAEEPTEATEEKPQLPSWLLRAAESMASRSGRMMLSGDQKRWERLLVLAGTPTGSPRSCLVDSGWYSPPSG